MKAVLIYVSLFLLHLTNTSCLNSTNAQSLTQIQYTRITKRSISQAKGVKKNVHDISIPFISDFKLMSNLIPFNYNKIESKQTKEFQTTEVRKINGEFRLASDSDKVIASNVDSVIDSTDRLKGPQKFGDSYLIRKEPSLKVMWKYKSVHHDVNYT